MKIVELILDEDQDTIGIDAISIVESPAIESDFVALNQQEIKLAEVDKEKKILLGALLIPNKPIYRNGEEGEYYIFFSKDTIVKASQMYLQNGYQNKSTLEHSKALEGLTLVESWIVEDEVNDKSRKYGLNVPVGSWMGAVKVNNDEVWNEYVKTNKVKGFSIEGYFADKMERPKESVKEDMGKTMEVEAAELLSKIESIVKGEKLELAERVELNEIKDLQAAALKISRLRDGAYGRNKDALTIEDNLKPLLKTIEKEKNFAKDILEASTNTSFMDSAKEDLKNSFNKLSNAANELGVSPNKLPVYKDYESALNELKEYEGFTKDAISISKRILK